MPMPSNACTSFKQYLNELEQTGNPLFGKQNKLEEDEEEEFRFGEQDAEENDY